MNSFPDVFSGGEIKMDGPGWGYGTQATSGGSGGGFNPSVISEPASTSQVLFPNAVSPGGGIQDATFSVPGDASQVLFPNAASNTGIFAPDPQQQQGGFDISKILPAAIGGAGSLIGAIRGQGGKGDRALQLQQQATKPLAAVGNQLTSAYASGQLSQSQQALADLKKQAALAKWRQYFADAGIPESTAMVMAENKVEQDDMAFKNQQLQQNIDNSFKIAALNTNNLGSIARQQALQDAEQRKAWADFMAQLAKIGGDMGPIMVGGNNP